MTYNRHNSIVANPLPARARYNRRFRKLVVTKVERSERFVVVTRRAK